MYLLKEEYGDKIMKCVYFNSLGDLMYDIVYLKAYM